MRRNSEALRSPRRLLASLTLVLAAGLLSAVPADAHVFTKNDANDSASKIDLRSASVSHTSTSVVHSVRTWNSWTPASLQHDSFFVIGINKDNDAGYERCAFIYFTSRLRGQLSNCGSQFIRFLPVAKVNATTAKITIPKAVLTPAYTWFARSLWVGAAPCGNGCNDFAPNTLPDPLHDLQPPIISMGTTPLRTWVDSNTLDFGYFFSVNDAHTGVATWLVERRAFESASWSAAASGTGGGSKGPTITAVPGHSFYRVVATDKQGNVKVSPSVKVFAPRDDDELGLQGVYGGTPVSVDDADAFLGSYTSLGVGDSLDYTYTQTGGPCRPFELIGPGGGDWTVDVSVNGGFHSTIDGTLTPSGPRQILFTYQMCDSTFFEFDVTEAAAEFGVDGVVARPS